MKKRHGLPTGTTFTLIVLTLGLGAFPGALAAEEGSDGSPWHVGLSAGWRDYEGDEAVKDAFVPSVLVGYDLSDRWTVEGILSFAPNMDEQFRHSYGQRISRLEEEAGPGIHDTTAAGLAVEGLFHFDRFTRLDPYLVLGAGVTRYADDFDCEYEPDVRAGVGVQWHLNGQWAVRADARGMYAGTDPEWNSMVGVGITWTPGRAGEGRRLPARPERSPEAAPSAKPAEKVPVPAAPAENVKKYELHIEFAENSAEITAQYFGELDVIGKELRDQPAARAKIEAHVDQRKNSVEKAAVKLTEKRARAVQDYLASQWKVRKSRMESIGHGFSKPKEKADLENGNLANRRIDVSIITPAGK